MIEYTDPIRQDRTKCYFFYTIEEAMEMIEEVKTRRKRNYDDDY